MRKISCAAMFLSAAAMTGWCGEAFADFPKPVARASVSSIKNAEAFLTRIGVSLQIAPMIEKRLDLAPGTLATDKPVGVAVAADKESWDAAPNGSAMVVAVLPVVAGKGTIEEIKSKGGFEVIGRDDFATRGGYFFKRGTDHLFVSTGSDHAAGMVPEDAFKADYAQNPPLAAITGNFALAKAALPVVYKRFMAGGDVMTGADVANLDHLSLQFAPQGDNLQMKCWWVPGTMVAPAAHPRPSFPGTVLGEIHLTRAKGDTNPLLAVLSQSGELPKFQIVGPLLSLADAASIAITVDGAKQPTLSVVSQFDGENQTLADFKTAWADGVKKGSGKALTTYASGGKTVNRGVIEASAGGGKTLYIDLLADQHVVYATVSTSDAHLVEQLAAAGMKGQIPAGMVAIGEIDLGGCLSAFQELGGAATLGAPAITSALSGGRIQFTSQVASGYVYSDFEIPIPVVKNVITLATTLFGTPAAPAGRGTATPGRNNRAGAGGSPPR